MPKDNLVYVGHMLDMAASALDKVRGKTRAEYDADENLRLALAHLVQVVGEAARRVAPEFRGRYPQIPWTQIVGMRHKIVHDYMHVDFKILWGVVTVELPALVALLEPIAPPLDDPEFGPPPSP